MSHFSPEINHGQSGVNLADGCADAVEDGLSDTLEDFLRGTGAPRPPIVEQLIPSAGIVLAHGQPRSRKSIVTIHAMLAAAAGVPPFGLDRLRVAEPVSVLYLTEEDHAAAVKQRIVAMLAGLELSVAPQTFRISARKGLWLPDAREQDRLLRHVERHRVRLLALDPVRGVTDQVDKGPGDLAPFTRFLRRLMRETEVIVILPHHDTKPRNDGKPDDRPRAQRASGGGILSISECPIHVERVSDDTSLLVPNHWKYEADPPAIKVRFVSSPGVLRLVGENVDVDAAPGLVLHERILGVLGDRPGQSGNKVTAHVHARKDDVARALEQLARAGKVNSIKAGRATKWFVAGQAR